MTINSHDAILASLSALKGQDRQFSKTLTTIAAGTCVSPWALGDYPAAGSYGTARVMRTCSSSTTGALSFSNASGTDEIYLTGWGAQSTAAATGTLILYDRIADVAGIDFTTTSTQTITSSTYTRSATGAGVQMFLEVSTTIVGTPVFTLSYTDQDGNAGATTGTVTCAANSATRLAYAGSPWIPLAAADSGVRALASLTCSVAGSAGVGTIVLARPIAQIPLISANGYIETSLATQYPKLPQLEDSHCLAFLIFGGTSSAGSVSGNINAVAG